MIAELLTGVSLVCSLIVAVGMALSFRTTYRFWPPGDRDWRWAAYFGTSTVAFGALLACNVIVIEPLPDYDLRTSLLTHRGTSHSLVTAGVVGMV